MSRPPLVACMTFVAIVSILGCGPRPPVHEVAKVQEGKVRLALADVADGEVHFYTYAHGDTNVDFLVRTDGTGALQTHLDACYSCYQYRRGFVVEDDALVCIACRLEYPIADEVWEFIGACAPIAIHSEVDGLDLVIDRRLLDRAAKYF